MSTSPGSITRLHPELEHCHCRSNLHVLLQVTENKDDDSGSREDTNGDREERNVIEVKCELVKSWRPGTVLGCVFLRGREGTESRHQFPSSGLTPHGDSSLRLPPANEREHRPGGLWSGDGSRDWGHVANETIVSGIPSIDSTRTLHTEEAERCQRHREH